MDLYKLLSEIGGDRFVIMPIKDNKTLKEEAVHISLSRTAKQVRIKAVGAKINIGSTIPLVNIPYEKLIEIHNNYVDKYNSQSVSKRSKIVSLSKEDKENIKGRWNESGGDYGNLEAWEDLFRRIEKSSFLSSQSSSSWFKGLKWVIKPNNFSKLVVGDYDDCNMKWFVDKEAKENESILKEEEKAKKAELASKPDEMTDLEKKLYDKMRNRKRN